MVIRFVIPKRQRAKGQKAKGQRAKGKCVILIFLKNTKYYRIRLIQMSRLIQISEKINNEFSLPHKPTLTHGGRLPGLYTYDIVNYEEKEYAVITIEHKKKEVRFIIDNCNLTKVLTNYWHLSSGKYIATNYTLQDGKIKQVCLHNFIKDNCMNETSDKIVVHINNNMLDNRIENLRIMKSCEYFSLRNNRKRTITLPPDCGFEIDDIPKYVSFMKASGEHGDRFAIEIPQLNLFLKLSSSKKVLIKDKFDETIQKLNEIYKTYPDVNPHINDTLIFELNKSFECILQCVS
jgi:hypothetical protein